ncbi:HAD family hydrolase [Amnibacterium kyonggiense]|uniref:Phosphoglycolate phosphatase-like HAD superfamily hydrolase n=1 Tax=Amnibacterium kyonggiense TaxID=595671 RepID=A0A4R7FME2_9MICO|nr:HAD family hydrolase [Amnibacterium kyonggiense]TDS77627.1 phosphoglycolate phosphatase-like HAD superfamily hydrolase [Amnibacterium kyonggiense]
MRIVLWDVDGTLLLNSKKAGAFYHDAIREVAGVVPPPGEPHAVEHGKTDAQIITERLTRWGGDLAHFDAVSARMDELSDAYLTDAARREAAVGVPEALRAFADAGWTNGLLTGNSRHRARVKLEGAGVDVGAFDWTRSYFGDRFVRRSDLTSAARDELAEATAVILGDTPADGEAADAVGFPFLAVATGAYSVAELRETSARSVVPDLEQGLPSLLETLRAL